jgi:hypothetical protein
VAPPNIHILIQTPRNAVLEGKVLVGRKRPNSSPGDLMKKVHRRRDSYYQDYFKGAEAPLPPADSVPRRDTLINTPRTASLSVREEGGDVAATLWESWSPPP